MQDRPTFFVRNFGAHDRSRKASREKSAGEGGWGPAETTRRESDDAPAGSQRVSIGQIDTSTTAGEVSRARPGERVSLSFDVIRADRRDDFERFLHEILGPAASAADPGLMSHVRILEPSHANADGTWTYATLIDPLPEGAEFDWRGYLIMAYGDHDAGEHERLWDECHAAVPLEADERQTVW